MNHAGLLFASFLLLGAVGCFSYSVTIALAPSSESPSELTERERAQATEIVSGVVSGFGLVPDKRLSEIEESSLKDREWKDRVVALYSAGPEALIEERVGVWVLVNKATNRYSVLIRDLDSSGRTEFTDSLELSLTEALSNKFPTRTVEVERGTVGPSFGP